MAFSLRPGQFASLVAVLAASMGLAQAQDATSPNGEVLLFVFAFVGGLVLFAYVASKLMKPPKRRPDNEPVIPLPVSRRR